MVVQKDNSRVDQKTYKHVKTLRRQNAERAVFLMLEQLVGPMRGHRRDLNC